MVSPARPLATFALLLVLALAPAAVAGASEAVPRGRRLALLAGTERHRPQLTSRGNPAQKAGAELHARALAPAHAAGVKALAPAPPVALHHAARATAKAAAKGATHHAHAPHVSLLGTGASSALLDILDGVKAPAGVPP